MSKEDDECGTEVHVSITELLKKSVSWNRFNPSDVWICKVPNTLRCFHPTAYSPKILSIGPLHKGDIRLRAMMEHKATYMYQLFKRTIMEKFMGENIEIIDMGENIVIIDRGENIQIIAMGENIQIIAMGENIQIIAMGENIQIIAKDCAKAVLQLETSARAYYAQGSVTYENFKFAEMMVIDGCFILELLYRFSHPGSILFDSLTLQEVKSDLLLLENQIPFFILEELFNLTLKTIDRCPSLIDLILLFFKDMDILHNVQLGPVDEEVKHCHILGFLQSCYKPTKDISWGEIPTISFSATEIAGAGVIFKPNKDKSPLLAVKFEKSPLFQGMATPDMVKDASFKIPVMCINHFTVTFLRNLIAYEQCCCPSTDHYVTSFAFLMDKLIETKDDVSLLVRSKVLQHHLGACEEVTTIFNNICNGVVLQGFHYSSEVKGFEDYCERSWPTLLISLRNLYRTTTWQTLTVIAAIVVFILTLIQTIIAICSV